MDAVSLDRVTKPRPPIQLSLSPRDRAAIGHVPRKGMYVGSNPTGGFRGTTRSRSRSRSRTTRNRNMDGSFALLSTLVLY
jgi:hypothetical protein